MEKILVMHIETYKNFYNSMIKSLDISEDPVETVVQFYETKVAIDNNVKIGSIEVFDLDLYIDIMESNDLEVKYAEDWDDEDV